MSEDVGRKRELVRLGDAELAQRLASAWEIYDDSGNRLASRTRVKSAKLSRFWTTLTGSPGFRVIDWSLRFVIAAAANGTRPIRQRLIVQDEAVEMDDVLCEIRDIMKEMERRVEQRK